MTTNNILLFKYTDIYPSVDIEFEDRKYMIMNNYDAYLKTMYGNYMELPPEDKRVWHFDGEIKFE
jgi:lipopolysaccharide cholinephosphotransferase